MKNKVNQNKLISLFTMIILSFAVFSCQRDNDAAQDDLPQEELTNIVLNVKDLSTQETKSYNYSVGAGSAPVIKLEDGKSYEVQTVYMNGDEDVTDEIRDAKDEHFMIFDFPKSIINLTREDPASSTRTDGAKVGLLTKWEVVKVENSSTPLLKITLIHEPVSVNEAQNGTAWGSVAGGETDAEAVFGLGN